MQLDNPAGSLGPAQIQVPWGDGECLGLLQGNCSDSCYLWGNSSLLWVKEKKAKWRQIRFASMQTAVGITWWVSTLQAALWDAPVWTKVWCPLKQLSCRGLNLGLHIFLICPLFFFPRLGLPAPFHLTKPRQLTVMSCSWDFVRDTYPFIPAQLRSWAFQGPA